MADVISGLKSHVTKNDSLGLELSVSTRQFKFPSTELIPAGMESTIAIDLIVNTIKVRAARTIFREYLKAQNLDSNFTNSAAFYDFLKLEFYHRIGGMGDSRNS